MTARKPPAADYTIGHNTAAEERRCAYPGCKIGPMDAPNHQPDHHEEAPSFCGDAYCHPFTPAAPRAEELTCGAKDRSSPRVCDLPPHPDTIYHADSRLPWNATDEQIQAFEAARKPLAPNPPAPVDARCNCTGKYDGEHTLTCPAFVIVGHNPPAPRAEEKKPTHFHDPATCSSTHGGFALPSPVKNHSWPACQDKECVQHAPHWHAMGYKPAPPEAAPEEKVVLCRINHTPTNTRTPWTECGHKIHDTPYFETAALNAATIRRVMPGGEK